MNKAFLLYLWQKGLIFFCLAISASVFLYCLLNVIHAMIAGEKDWKKKAVWASVFCGLSLLLGFIYFAPYSLFSHG